MSKTDWGATEILPNPLFTQVIAATPLVSMDLIVRNERGEVLLGQRRNRPAQGYWFVPGGRIRKNERLAHAFTRLCATELGAAFTFDQARMLGNFEHFYSDNALGVDGVSTHYVVLAYQLEATNTMRVSLDDQHAAQQWWNVDALLSSDRVHAHTKAYFCSTMAV